VDEASLLIDDEVRAKGWDSDLSVHVLVADRARLLELEILFDRHRAVATESIGHLPSVARGLGHGKAGDGTNRSRRLRRRMLM